MKTQTLFAFTFLLVLSLGFGVPCKNSCQSCDKKEYRMANIRTSCNNAAIACEFDAGWKLASVENEKQLVGIAKKIAQTINTFGAWTSGEKTRSGWVWTALEEKISEEILTKIPRKSNGKYIYLSPSSNSGIELNVANEAECKDELYALCERCIDDNGDV